MRGKHAGSGPKRSRGTANVIMMTLGALLLLGAGLAVAYPAWWNHRKTVVSQRLIKQFQETPPPRTPAKVASACVDPPQDTKGLSAAGIVKIPALLLTAPVVPGLSDAALAVAAGHDPDSPWPGQKGESVLESHDVSFFSRISDLKKGNRVIWIDHCSVLDFVVVGHEILSPGQQINPPPGDHGLALITCYPTNALFYTPYRFVLLTTYLSTTKPPTTPRRPRVVVPHLKVPAPPDLVAQGLTLADSDVLVGYLYQVGSPSPGWLQGPAGLDLQTLALESYIGAEKAVLEHNASWWADLAEPGVPMPAQLWSNDDDTNVTEDVVGDTPVSVTLSSPAETVVLVNLNGDLLIKSVTVPAPPRTSTST
jgi:sortase A